MKLLILANLFLAGFAVAVDCTCADITSVRPLFSTFSTPLSSTTPTPLSSLSSTPIPDNEPCMSDGSMGTCKSRVCIQLPGQSQGACKASK